MGIAMATGGSLIFRLCVAPSGRIILGAPAEGSASERVQSALPLLLRGGTGAQGTRRRHRAAFLAPPGLGLPGQLPLWAEADLLHFKAEWIQGEAAFQFPEPPLEIQLLSHILRYK